MSHCLETKLDAFMQKYASNWQQWWRELVHWICTDTDSFLWVSHCEFGPCETSNPCENGAVCREKMNLEAFPLGCQCQWRRALQVPRVRSLSVLLAWTWLWPWTHSATTILIEQSTKTLMEEWNSSGCNHGYLVKVICLQYQN